MNGNDIILYALFTVSATITLDSASKHSVLRAFRAVHPYSFINRVQLPHVKLFGLDYPDANAIDDFRFTISELQDLSEALHIPEVFKTTQRDCVEGYEALAMLCYRLSYPGKWSRVRKAFGRSEASCCRIVLALIDLLDEKWGNLLYFNAELYTSRHGKLIVMQSSTRLKALSTAFPFSSMELNVPYAVHQRWTVCSRHWMTFPSAKWRVSNACAILDTNASIVWATKVLMHQMVCSSINTWNNNYSVYTDLQEYVYRFMDRLKEGDMTGPCLDLAAFWSISESIQCCQLWVSAYTVTQRMARTIFCALPS